MADVIRRRRPGEVRELLVRAAAIEFSDHGYAGTTMRAVASSAGISLSVLHHHFPSKQSLFSAALVAPFLRFFDEFGSAWSAQLEQPWDDRELTRAFVERLYRSLSDYRRTLVNLLAVAESSDGQVLDEIRGAVAEMRSRLAAMGEHEARRRGFAAGAAPLTNRMIAALVTGLVLLHPFFSEGDPDEDERLIEVATDVVLTGIRGRAETDR
jgi:AcrR family transcriptional regulator